MKSEEGGSSRPVARLDVGFPSTEEGGTALRRAYAKRQASHKPEPARSADPTVAPGREIQLPLDRDELLGLMQDSLEALALELGMLVASSLLEDEVTLLCGRRYERQPDRTHTRYGHQRGTATLAGQKIAIARPACDAPTAAARSRWRPTPDCSPPTPCPGPCSAAWSAA